MKKLKISYSRPKKVPDQRGHFGPYGGRYVAETLMPALTELEDAYKNARRDSNFRKTFNRHLREYAGRETPLYFAERLTEKLGGAKVYLKREDLCHTGAHKINNTIGQILLARQMKKEKRPNHRRNRCGAARSRDRHSRGAIRDAMRDFHG
jgi:tryptophan synthase beta chain